MAEKKSRSRSPGESPTKSPGTWRKPRSQFGALPFRFDDHGGLEIMLITSRETRRWIIPKGWPMRTLKPHRTAEREAFEEAGLKGKIGKTEVGRYGYEKRLANGMTVPVEVTVFPLKVQARHKRWPEMDQRDGRWFSAEEAATLVEEDGLQELLWSFEPAAAPKSFPERAAGSGKTGKASPAKRDPPDPVEKHGPSRKKKETA